MQNEDRWSRSFTAYEPQDECRRESLFCLGNGLLLVRGAVPGMTGSDSYSGTYFAGCYDQLTSKIAGERVEDRSLVNFPNWLALSIRLAGEATPLSLSDYEILDYRHRLDMKRGVTERDVLLRDRSGLETRLCEERFVSMATPHLAAFRLKIEPCNWSGEVELVSGIDGDVVNDNVARFASYEKRHLNAVAARREHPDLLLLEARTRQSGVRIAVAARNRLTLGDAPVRTFGQEKYIADVFCAAAGPGHPLVLEKTAAIYSTPKDAAIDPVSEALDALSTAPDYATLRREHVEAWDRLWQQSHLEADDPGIERGLRFHAFHILQTVSPLRGDLDVGLPARGWQEAYRGHIFWDELFAFPFLDLRFPAASRALLLYRHRRLGAARQEALGRGLGGAMFPWRSAVSGREETPRFQQNPISGRFIPDRTDRQVHIAAAVALDLCRHVRSTGDDALMSQFGAELLIEIARLFASLAEPNKSTGRYHIRGVVGPDEFHTAYPDRGKPGIDDNAYTNVMAAWCLCQALEVWARLEPAARADLADRLAVSEGELAQWDDISCRLCVPFHDDGVISQFAGFDKLAELEIESLGGQRADWALEARGDNVNRYQIVKQADVAMLLYLLPPQELIALFGRLGYAVDEVQLERTLAYYFSRTSHDSSLSYIAWAGALAHFRPDWAQSCFLKGVRLDLNPSNQASSREGVHLGAMAGSLDIVQRCYIGLTLHGEEIVIEPALPKDLPAISFTFRCGPGCFKVGHENRQVWIFSQSDNPKPAKLRVRGQTIELLPGATWLVPSL